MSQQLCLFAPEPCINPTTSSGPGPFQKPLVTSNTAVPPKTAQKETAHQEENTTREEEGDLLKLTAHSLLPKRAEGRSYKLIKVQSSYCNVMYCMSNIIERNSDRHF